MTLAAPATGGRPTIGVAIIARNEAGRLERCLKSISWADEIVVVDDCSGDGTADLARRLGCRVETRPMRDFAEQRNHALGLLSTDWVLHIDADEECTGELRDEILAALPGARCAGFMIPRRNRFLGRVMRARDWSDCRLLRLGRRIGSSWERPVHEKLQVSGPVEEMRSWLDHHGDLDYAERVRKSNLYSTREAEILAAKGARFRLRRLLLIPALKALKSYLLNGGWRDGMIGLIWAGHVWWSNFTILVKLWEIERARAAGSGGRHEA